MVIWLHSLCYYIHNWLGGIIISYNFILFHNIVVACLMSLYGKYTSIIYAVFGTYIWQIINMNSINWLLTIRFYCYIRYSCSANISFIIWNTYRAMLVESWCFIHMLTTMFASRSNQTNILRKVYNCPTKACDHVWSCTYLTWKTYH